MIIWSGISVAINESIFITLMTRAMVNSADTHPKLAHDTDL